MKIWNPTLKRLIIPEISAQHYLYRLPFYLNFICVGYNSYWQFKDELYTYPASDSTGRTDAAAVIGVITWLIALFLVLNARLDKKRKDTIGMVYLIAVFIFCVVSPFIFGSDRYWYIFQGNP